MLIENLGTPSRQRVSFLKYTGRQAGTVEQPVSLAVRTSNIAATFVRG